MKNHFGETLNKIKPIAHTRQKQLMDKKVKNPVLKQTLSFSIYFQRVRDARAKGKKQLSA